MGPRCPLYRGSTVQSCGVHIIICAVHLSTGRGGRILVRRGRREHGWMGDGGSG